MGLKTDNKVVRSRSIPSWSILFHWLSGGRCPFWCFYFVEGGGFKNCYSSVCPLSAIFDNVVCFSRNARGHVLLGNVDKGSTPCSLGIHEWLFLLASSQRHQFCLGQAIVACTLPCCVSRSLEFLSQLDQRKGCTRKMKCTAPNLSELHPIILFEPIILTWCVRSCSSAPEECHSFLLHPDTRKKFFDHHLILQWCISHGRSKELIFIVKTRCADNDVLDS